MSIFFNALEVPPAVPLTLRCQQKTVQQFGYRWAFRCGHPKHANTVFLDNRNLKGQQLFAPRCVVMALKHDRWKQNHPELMTAHKSAFKNTFFLLQRHTVYSQGLFWLRMHICYDSDRTMMEDAALIYKVYSEWAAFPLLWMVLQLTQRSWSGAGKLSHLAPHMIRSRSASCRLELETRHVEVVSNWWNWLQGFFYSDAKMSEPTCSNPKVGIFTDTRHLPHSLWTLIVLAYGQLKLGQILFFFTGLQDVDSRGLLASKGLQPGYKNFQLLQCPHRKSGFAPPSPWKSMFQSTSYLLNFSARFSTK